MGLPNIGLAAAKTIMPEIMARAGDKHVIVSASPTLSSEHGDSITQARRLVSELLSTGVEFIELNVSCPNVVTEDGSRKPVMGYDIDAMAKLLEALHDEIGTGRGLGVKLPPYRSESEQDMVPELAILLRSSRVFKFIVTANTVPGQIPLAASGQPILSVPEGRGGMSGPGTKEIGRHQLRLWKEHVGDEIEIISTLGVDSGRELAVRRNLGAVAAGGVTFLWESDNWPRTVSNLLSDYAETV
jgi:dihydroorotate dehydrogenase